ncbi:MAG: hypothetical protein ABH952_07440 [Candidatus Omnitrophota bacterium]
MLLYSFILSLPHAQLGIAIGDSLSFIQQAGGEFAAISLTNQLFSELDLNGFTIGAQSLIKMRIYALAKAGKEPEQIKEELVNSILPTIRLIEHLCQDLPTVGMEIHRAINPNDPADESLANAQAVLANYFSFIKTPHLLGKSNVNPGERNEQLEMRILPASYPIFKLIIDSFVEIGMLPDSKRHIYLSTVQGDLANEIILLLAATYFLDFPSNLGTNPNVLKSFISTQLDTLGFPGCYTYIGVTLDPLTGSTLGRRTQSNIVNKMIAINIRFSPDIPVLPVYLYQTDVKRKALLSTAALAYRKLPANRSGLETELAGIYEGLKEKLGNFYSSLVVTSQQTEQLLGTGYTSGYAPPNGVDKIYIYNAVELL